MKISIYKIYNIKAKMLEMRISKLLFLIITLFLSNTLASFSQGLKIESFKHFEAGLTFDYGTSSSYYNLKDSLVSSYGDHIIRKDTNGLVTIDTVLNYTFDFSKVTTTFFFKYLYNDNFSVYANLPLSFYTLSEQYFADANGSRYDKTSYSLTRLDYFEIGAKYGVNTEKYNASLLGSVRIPTGFDKEQFHMDSSKTESIANFEFLSDGAMEFLFGTHLEYKAKTVTIESDVIYDKRTEDFKDQLIINAGVGISSVPNTQLKLFTQIRLSMESFDNARPLNPLEEVVQDDNYAMGGQFSILFSQNIQTKMSYYVTLAGTNTWNFGNFQIYLGYRF